MYTFDPTGSKPVCRICNASEPHWLGDHLLEVHGLSVESYLAAHPGAHTITAELSKALAAKAPATRVAAPAKPTLSVKIGGMSFPVHANVPESACLMLPGHYRIPEHGDLASDVQDVLIALKCGRTTWVWGPPGTGKDAVFHAYAAMTRTPSLLFQVVQGADIQAWKYTRSFDHEGTKWEDGDLLKALRDGYVTADGERVPYLIVLSDIDRATRQQAEELRQILDSIQGRITGPTGKVDPVLAGTVIVATANSSGGGDESGRCISANPIDASIMDRFERKVEFHNMDARDEEPILFAKFPTLVSAHPKAIPAMMKATAAVRDAIAKNEVYCEWTHRTVSAWASATQDLMVTLGSKSGGEKIVGRALRMVLDGLPTRDTREAVKRLIDPHITGGAIPEGNTSHINPSGLSRP